MSKPARRASRLETALTVPFFRPSIGQAEIDEVTDTLRSGHLTTGPRAARFEDDFTEFLGVPFGVAVNSATAALHLALEAVGVGPGDAVILPTMTFAATAEVVEHLGATPIFVDCDAVTLCMDVDALRHTIKAARAQVACAGLRPPFGPVKAIVPMHYGGQMTDASAIRELADEAGVFVVEDATHALPAMYRATDSSPWTSVGTTADITCFSFYANKSITTGEGGMAVTANAEWADRMRVMSLHGISRRGTRFQNTSPWYYHVVEAGFKYNMPDLSAAIGIHQLRRANEMWKARQHVAGRYLAALGTLKMFDLPRQIPNRKHAWHLFAVRLAHGKWRISRDRFIHELRERGIACSVHWMPLHLHPYYTGKYDYEPGGFPVSEDSWPRLVSLPIFPDMTASEQGHVIDVIAAVAREYQS